MLFLDKSFLKIRHENAYLKISSIFFRPSFPIIKKAPAPNNTVGIAKYRISDNGSPHILSITITTISNIWVYYPLSKKDTPPNRYELKENRAFSKWK